MAESTDKPWQFKPGNKHAVGRGRPYAKEQAALRKAIFDNTSPNDMAVIWKRLVAMGKRGNIRAIELIMDRCFGKAVAMMEISSSEAEENVKEMTTEELMRLAMGMDDTSKN